MTDDPMRGTMRNVLVTGGSGSFAQAFVARLLAEREATRIVVFSRDELKQAQMAERFGHDRRLHFFLGDVRDRDRLAWAMEGADTVVHAAAMKRVEACEANPWEAVRTNVVGTQNVAEAAIRAGVQRAVFLSTDKAPAAHTLYGATKFAAERLWLRSNVYAGRDRTRLSATRYGNVIGSRGSVLHLWREQASTGHPVTVTDARCSRYWMTLDQAVDLVLLALRTMRGGEVFVPKVPSAPLLALAEAVAPGADVVEIGMRGQERLHETLISADESPNTYDAGTHYIIEPDSRPWGEVPPPPFPRVPAGFVYRSDSNPEQFDAASLRDLIAEAA